MALENLLDIADNIQLAREKERISKREALALYRDGSLDDMTPGTYEALAAIHRRLFGSIYAFAGKTRSANIAKGNFRFASVAYLDAAIKAVESMPQSSAKEIIDKYVEMNVVHPFREGNGRAMRIWVDHIFRNELGLSIDWSGIDREDYLFAMERSPIRSTEIKGLIMQALVPVDDAPALLARSIDASYAYEGYDAYSAADL